MRHSTTHNFIQALTGRILIHILFWVLAAAFLIYFFGHFTEDYRFTSIFVCLLMPIAIGTTYLINYFLIPRYLMRKRYFRFGWYFVFTLILSIWGALMVIVYSFIELADYQYSNMPPLTADIFYLVVGLYFPVFFSTTVKFLKHWYKSQQQISDLRNKQLEAELKFLKGQIQPHFLFNTLNNLYGLALEKSNQVPDAILRLSDLLDALLYRSHNKLIPLTTELKLIEDYVQLEKLRFEDRLEIQWKTQGEIEGYDIAPFLLFPFLENAFKHGFSENTELLKLMVEAEVDNGQLYFKVNNSIVHGSTDNPALSGGIGLTNVQKRLELQYPDKYHLHIDAASDTYYQIALQLTLDPINTYAYAT